MSTIKIDVFYLADEPPFICAVNGKAMLDTLQQIEDELTSEDRSLFDDEGTYSFDVNWIDDWDHYAQEPCGGYWDFTRTAFTRIQEAEAEHG